MSKQSKILSIGSGLIDGKNQSDILTLDISSEVNPDVVWDLNMTPLPFLDSEFHEIQCFDVIEHINDIPSIMQELYRILTPKGMLKITTPHSSCDNSYVDPIHKWHLSYFSFDYFSDNHKLSYYSKANYSKAKFKINYRHIQFQGGRINRSLISRLANKFPKTYEQKWAWIFPAWYIYLELEAIR